MSEHVTPGPLPVPTASAAGDPPAWLRQQFLTAEEQVVWWQGPKVGRWEEWCINHQPTIALVSFGSAFALLVTGIVLDTPVWYGLGLLLGWGLLLANILITGSANSQRWQVVTTQRLLIIVGRKKSEEFDLGLLRRILASMGSTDGLPADDRVLGSKFGAVEGEKGPVEGITDLGAVLAMARLVQQMQGVRRGE
jgi:hypothetical protein